MLFSKLQLVFKVRRNWDAYYFAADLHLLNTDYLSENVFIYFLLFSVWETLNPSKLIKNYCIFNLCDLSFSSKMVKAKESVLTWQVPLSFYPNLSLSLSVQYILQILHLVLYF